MPVRVIKPQAGPQEQFLASPADIAIYGGAAGSGKTWGVLMEPLRHVTNTPDFYAVFFRRSLGHENRQISIAREIARATDAIHQFAATDVS